MESCEVFAPSWESVSVKKMVQGLRTGSWFRLLLEERLASEQGPEGGTLHGRKTLGGSTINYKNKKMQSYKTILPVARRFFQD